MVRPCVKIATAYWSYISPLGKKSSPYVPTRDKCTAGIRPLGIVRTGIWSPSSLISASTLPISYEPSSTAVISTWSSPCRSPGFQFTRLNSDILKRRSGPAQCKSEAIARIPIKRRETAILGNTSQILWRSEEGMMMREADYSLGVNRRCW